MKYGRKNHRPTDLETAADAAACRCAILMKMAPKSEWKKIFISETQGRDEKYCADVRKFTMDRLKGMGVIK